MLLYMRVDSLIVDYKGHVDENSAFFFEDPSKIIQLPVKMIKNTALFRNNTLRVKQVCIYSKF